MPGSCQVVGLARCLGLDWFLRQGQHCSWTTVRIGGECSVGSCPGGLGVPTLALAVAAVALAIALAIAILSRLSWIRWRLHGGVLGSGALGLVSGSPALVSGWPGLVSRCPGLLGIPGLLGFLETQKIMALRTELRTRPWEDQLEP